MKKDNIKISTVLAFAVLFGILLMSILAPWLAPYDPLKIDMKNALLPPSKLHLLGTDNIGRDILSRVIYGGRQSIVLAAIATSMSMALGCIMIAIAGLMGSGVTSMMLALVITSWVGFSRIVRGEVMKIKKEYFIEGLRSFGVGHMRILFYHVMPNLISSIVIIFATRIASSILSVASLSFLGLGLEPPTPDWGVMISDARMYYRTSPMLVIAPGVCIVLFSLCVNIIADWLRDRLDVRRDSVKE